MSTTLRLLSLFLFFVILSCDKNNEVAESTDASQKCVILKSTETNFQNNQIRRFEGVFDGSLNSIKEIRDSKDGRWVNDYKNYYDNKGLLVKREEFTESGIRNFVATYEYHRNGNLKSKIADSEHQIITNTFTESGKPLRNLQRNKSQNFDFGIHNFTYNKNGDLILEEFTLSKELIYRTEQVYDNKNRLLKRVDSNKNRTDVTDFEYDASGKLVLEKRNSSLVKQYFYKNKKLTETVRKSAGVFTYGEKYEYDAEGREVKVLMSKNGKDYVPFTEKQYFPNSNQMKNYKIYFFQPNSMTKSILVHDITYDQKGNQVKYLLYDSQNGRPFTQLDAEFKCK